MQPVRSAVQPGCAMSGVMVCPADMALTPPAGCRRGVERGHGRCGRVEPIVDRSGAGPVPPVAVAVRSRSTRSTPGVGHPVAPGGVGLEAVVEPAQRGEVVGLRGTGLWSALGLGVVVVRVDVVDVAAPGRVGCTTGTRMSLSRRMTCSRIRSGTSYAGVDSSALRSMTGLTVTLVRESAHQSLTWSRSTSRWPSSMPAGRTEHGGQPVEGRVEVGVEDDLAGGRQAV